MASGCTYGEQNLNLTGQMEVRKTVRKAGKHLVETVDKLTRVMSISFVIHCFIEEYILLIFSHISA